MKKIVIFIIFIFSIQFAIAQTYEFKTTNFSVSMKNEKGDWSNWSKVQPTELLIQLDRNKNRFVINSEIIQLYSIVKYEDVLETQTEITNKYYCVDNLGGDTLITIISPKGSGGIKQIYITNDIMSIEYDMIYTGQK